VQRQMPPPPPPPPQLSVFVYNSSLKCSDALHDSFLFQSKLAALFHSGFLRTHDPARADIFYHPVRVHERAACTLHC
jgi:hypothetical protein